MSEREALRESGAEIRNKLGIPGPQKPELAPGLGALVDEAAFGRLWARPGLAIEDRMLATLAALTSRQYLPQLTTFVAAALRIEMPIQTIQEVMIHCSLYSGFPTARNSLAIVADVAQRAGVALPQEDPPELDIPDLDAQGRETMVELHQDRAEAGYSEPGSAAYDLYITAIQYGYGAIWNRPGMTRRQRMICSVAAFTAIDSHTQCRKFFQSAPNVGLTKEEVMEVIMQTAPFSGFPRALNALMIAGEVLG